MRPVLSTFAVVCVAVSFVTAASDVANGMLEVIHNKGACKPVAVIFARGTFDSGNIGVWVGPAFQAALGRSVPGGVAFQGVEASAYKADLAGYLQEGGSASGAKNLAMIVNAYAAKCQDSKIIISGWSQGALVAHKAIAQVSAPTRQRVAGFVTFGDPNSKWDNLAVPASIPSKSLCVTGTVFDPLCAKLPGDFKIPTSVNDIVGPFKKLPSVAVGAQQAGAAAQLVTAFPGQLLGSFSSFVKQLTPSKLVRLLLTPQHFTYGNNGMVDQAAAFVAQHTKGAKVAAKGAAPAKGASKPALKRMVKKAASVHKIAGRK